MACQADSTPSPLLNNYPAPKTLLTESNLEVLHDAQMSALDKDTDSGSQPADDPIDRKPLLFLKNPLSCRYRYSYDSIGFLRDFAS